MIKGKTNLAPPAGYELKIKTHILQPTPYPTYLTYANSAKKEDLVQ